MIEAKKIRRAGNFPDSIDNALNLKDFVNSLYERMFTKYYSGNQLNSWHQLNYFGGGNADNYKFMINKLLECGHRVKTGYRTSSMIRGHKTYYIFYK
jgi:hypothetical protein